MSHGIRMMPVHQLKLNSRAPAQVDMSFGVEGPVGWKVTSGLGWKEEVADWKASTKEGRLPKVIDTWLDTLDGKVASEKIVLEKEWKEADKQGMLREIPPWVTSSYSILLEEGDSLMVAYRVMEKDIKFDIKQTITVPATDEEDLPSLLNKDLFHETSYSRVGTTSVVYWKPTEGFEDPDEYALEEDPNAKRTMQLDLVWDNSYSWYNSKQIMGIVGIFTSVAETDEIVESPKLPGSQNTSQKTDQKKWTRTIEKPLPCTETLTRSDSLSAASSSLKDAKADSKEPSHPLNKKQCDEATTRMAGKQGFLGEIALTGYLKEIGQTPNKDLMAAVVKDINDGCNIGANDLAVSSDAEFLTKEQCDIAKERVGSKTGPMAELVLKHYIKEIGKKASTKMMSRATEQITAGCEDEAKKLTPPQCLGIKEAVESKKKSGPEKQLQEVERGLESFGQVATAKMVTETVKQISNSCPGSNNAQPVEQVPRKKPPPPKKKTDDPAPLSTSLDPGECRQAQEAVKGKPSMFVGIHLGRWLKENGKDDSSKTINAVLAQLQADCGGEAPQVDVSNKKIEAKEEKDSSVSSGTIRRKDFVDDPRFAKYRMMKKIRQPMGSVEGRISMDKPDLLKTGLTELELECFLKLLFDMVEECNVAPPKGGKVLTLEFLNDPRLSKYKMMHKIKQPRGSVEGRMQMDKPDLLKAGLTDADLDCVLKLLFDGVSECDASPAGKILGPDFVQQENDLFKKYRMMKKLRQPPGAVEGRILMDMPDLEKLGFTKTDMDCFVKLLFEEVTQCICGPAEREQKLSKEAKGLNAAKDIVEKLTSLLDGDNGLLPGVLPSLDWATDIFEAKIPKKDKPKPTKPDANKAPGIQTFLDGKTQQNLGIILAKFPKDMVFEGYLTEVARAEWSFTKDPDEAPKYIELETFQRAILTVDDSAMDPVKPNVDKITDKHDSPHRFVKAMIKVKESNPDYNPSDVITCMLKQEDYGKAIQQKADTLEALQKYYETAGKLAGTISAAVNGFVVQLLNARVSAAKDGSKVSKEAFEEYDKVIRKMRQGCGGGDEADAAIVPLLAMNNVIIDKGMRLRVGLLRSHPELAKTLAPTYMELFKKYLDTIIASEQKQALEAEEEPPLSFAECEEAKEAQAKAKNPMFQEMALNNYLKGIGKTALKTKVMEMLKKPCKKPAVVGPLSDAQCKEAQGILKSTPNPMMQGIKLAGYFKEIGLVDQKKECQAQVDAGCPSGKPPEPLYLMSDLRDLCKPIVAEKDEPSSRNSVRGAIAGVKETQAKLKHCMGIMPALKQEPFEALWDEGQVVIDVANEIQESVYETVIQSAAPFLPHTKDGAIDRKALVDFYESFPVAGGSDDDKRIRGESGVAPKYKISDYLDDEALRYSFRNICKETLK